MSQAPSTPRPRIMRDESLSCETLVKAHAGVAVAGALLCTPAFGGIVYGVRLSRRRMLGTAIVSSAVGVVASTVLTLLYAPACEPQNREKSQV
mmetsp:Transcript_24053/g.60987  ORF Transcript_24053/g.60987 Transcript_24053/m.60987 type:complete len:93 (+) Transcript_24053:146-424(+)